jgi:hypothetical protein
MVSDSLTVLNRKRVMEFAMSRHDARLKPGHAPAGFQ